MANVTVMSWNVEVLGPKKGELSPNSELLFALIATVASQKSVDVLCIQELRSSVAVLACFKLLRNLAWATGETWTAYWTTARPRWSAESYGFFVRDRTAAVVRRAPGQRTVTDSENWDTSERLAAPSDPAFDLVAREFPGRERLPKGRRPAFAVLRARDGGGLFAVSSYHAPPEFDGATRGLARFTTDEAGAARPLPELVSVHELGTPEPVAIPCHFLAGDWNLPYTQGDYQSFQAATGTAPATAARTHLYAYGDRGRIPVLDRASTVGYRDANLDNVFVTTERLQAIDPDLRVVDVLADVLSRRGLRSLVDGYDPFHHSFPNVSQCWPVNNVERSFGFTRGAVSDHLPVFATGTV